MMGSVAARLAHQDAKTQAIFFNVFFKELRSVCGETSYGSTMQCRWIQADLDENAAELVGHMVTNED
jgi:hypothetical protein